MLPLDQFETITGFSPRPMQVEMWRRITGKDCAVLLKSPTGSGKTEAVLAPALAAQRRLFMIFPTRSLVEDQIQRISRTLKQRSCFGKRLSFVVDTGGVSRRRIFENGEEVTQQQFNPHRHLYDGDVIITTLDKFLYRFFGFGDERKGYIFPFRIFHGLRRNLFVFDEAHAYEDTAFSNFVRLIKALFVANLDIVLMTATMPDSYAHHLDFLDVVDYLSSNQPHLKTLHFIHLSENDNLVERIVEQALSCRGDDKRLIVTVEEVKDAVEIWQRLGKPFLYHGRLDGEQRSKVYAQIREREDNGESYTLVTTSAIEVGCDLNSDILLTEICNPASLVQRAGRCNRRGNRPNAQVIVVGNQIKPYLRDINESQESTFIQMMQSQDGKPFASGNFISVMQPVAMFDYRVEIMFDMLFEYVYQGKLENKPLHDKGLVVTRSWEPLVTLTTDIQRMSHTISVPISRCAAWREADWDTACKVYARYFNRYGNDYDVAYKELERGGCAYFKDLVVEVPPQGFDAEVGYLNLPKPFRHKWQNGYRENLECQSSSGNKQNLFYLNWRPEAPEQEEMLLEETSDETEEEDE